MSKSKKTKSSSGQSAQDTENSDAVTSFVADRGTRETIESIVIAIVLAFLFRAFEAEAFVIPTGSMAPTLQGRHIDVPCAQCGHRYRTGASCENPDAQPYDHVLLGICPICRYQMTLERPYLPYPHSKPEPNPVFDGPRNPDHESFTGDRILVCKFAYAVGDPQRWDVIVFKYPKNGKQNYIKRLIGLPGETIKIEGGDIYFKESADAPFQIARKPHYKLRTNLQLVDDTNHIAKSMIDVGWPARWQQWSHKRDERSWQIESIGNRQEFETDGNSNSIAWLRYRHLVPRWDVENLNLHVINLGEWDSISEDRLPPDLKENEDGEIERRGQLIADFYAYNLNVKDDHLRRMDAYSLPASSPWDHTGNFWVGDLGVECEVDVKSDEGELKLDLVEGGVHYLCSINIADGEARLSIEDRSQPDGSKEGFFIDEKTGEKATERKAKTELRGAGSYQLRFANVDDELNLWVNERHVKFAKVDGPTSYITTGNDRPYWSPGNPGDAEPIGIGSLGAAIKVKRLRVLRDVYYTALDARRFKDARQVFEDPSQWNDAPLFGTRDSHTFAPLGPDQFLPLGDNSPSSSDARYWGSGDRQIYVDRKLLTGKALYIYWPHGWNKPIPFLPNFERMRFIR